MSLLTTNWPSEFAELKKLDDILQCPICYEYINTCMITSCSHNFCSVCIRKYLQYKTQCPKCSAETYGSDLRKNRPLDEIITIYTNVKEHLLYKLRVINVTQSIKGCQTDSSECNGDVTPFKREDIDTSFDRETPKVEKKKKNVVQKLFSEKKMEKEPMVISGVTIPTIFQPHKSPKKQINAKKPDTTPCPVCNVDVPVKNINIHLDSCLAAADPVVKKPKSIIVENRKPLVKMVYSMLKDREIKKFLKDYNLNPNGDRKTMIWRLNRYTVLYNADCDTENPRPVSDIIKQVEKEEKEEKHNPLFQPIKTQKIVIDKKSDPETIDKANKDYIQSNKDHFKELIEAMRQRDGRNIKPLKSINRIDSDDEEKQQTNSNVLDNQLPSTSKAAELSLYSQDTIVETASDDDIFEKSPVKVEDQVHHINRDRIKIKEELSDDPQVLDDSPIEEKKINEQIENQDDDSNSFESVFDTSSISNVSNTKTPVGKKHSFASRKNPVTPLRSNPSSTNQNMEEMVEEIFNTNVDVSNYSEVDSETEEDGEDDSEEEAEFKLKTAKKKHDLSPEISPIKTRSKRKSVSADNNHLTTSERRKRVKRSVSPCI